MTHFVLILFLIFKIKQNAIRSDLPHSKKNNMNFLDKDPSENRTEFTKLKVACKYASIERGCAYR